jgi:hypothetical protein
MAVVTAGKLVSALSTSATPSEDNLLDLSVVPKHTSTLNNITAELGKTKSILFFFLFVCLFVCFLLSLHQLASFLFETCAYHDDDDDVLRINSCPRSSR